LAATLLGVSLAGVAGFACTKERAQSEPARLAASSLTQPSGDAPPTKATMGAPPAGPGTSAGSGTSASSGTPSGSVKIPSDLNVILLSIDSLRADMPWNGYDRDIAPRLTALEKTCVSYTNAYSISSYTSMSVGGFLGGRLPSELSRDGYFFGTYKKENLFFPELLKAAGVRTTSAHAHGYFTSAGFDQGFDKWEIVPGLKWNAQTDENVTSPKHEAIAERQLSDEKLNEGRFFAWYHFLDPHDEYVSHEADGINYGKKLRDRYDGEVTFTDRHVGKLLDFIAQKPWAKRTAIIVTSDHGEALGEHNQYKHGFEVWENLVRVPMFFCVPGLPARRIAQRRSAIDLAPTVLELYGLPKEAKFAGESLVPELLGGEAKPKDIVVDLPATSNNEKRRGLIHENLKVIGFGDQMFARVFDLEKDPGELNPITDKEVVSSMRQRLLDYNKTLKEVPAYACGKGCLEGTK
jgi:arylsulfatase A-like enzyme